MKRAGKWIWGAFATASTIQYAAAFLGAIVAIIAAGYANLSTGLRITLGVAVFGFATCLLLALIPLLPASVRRKQAQRPQPAPQRPPQSWTDVNPYSKAALLQRQHDELAKVESEREQATNVRRAIREVREELRDNRRLVQQAGTGFTDAIWELSGTKWKRYEGTLLDMDDSEPHSAAREAYRQLSGIEGTQYTRDSENPNLLHRRDLPGEVSHSDVTETVGAIDSAISALNRAEREQSQS